MRPDSLSTEPKSYCIKLVASAFFCALSDRVGRKPLLIIGNLLVALCTVPLFMLMEGATATLVLMAQLTLVILMCCMSGGQTVYLVEAFPPHLRTSGMAIALNITAVLFGGTLPLMAVWLTAYTGNPLAPAWYFVIAAFLTALIAIPMRSLDGPRT